MYSLNDCPYQCAIRAAIDGALNELCRHVRPPRSWIKIIPQGRAEDVSDADMAVSKRVTALLRGHFPKAAILSEEEDPLPEKLNAPLCFLVDPIDGTREYLRGGPNYAVTIAALEYGTVVAGAIAFPVTGRLLRASKGLGAFDGESLLVVLPSAHDRGLRIAVSPREADSPPMKLLMAPFDGHELIPIPSLTSKIGAFLFGDADAALFLSLVDTAFAWDYAAAALIVREAGGIMTNLRGESLTETISFENAAGYFAGDPRGHAQFLDRWRHVSTEIRGKTI